MKLIIDIPYEAYYTFKCDLEKGNPNLNALAEIVANGTPYNPTGDLISREALKEQVKNEVCEVCFDSPDERQCSPNCKLCTFKQLIDNAPTVDIKDQIAGAYNEGYMCGSREAEKARPQGEYVDISKLRLMTVEECAGHTIGYAMGWKACVEWIKKGGAE